VLKTTRDDEVVLTCLCAERREIKRLLTGTA
jgi:hypothetical protein